MLCNKCGEEISSVAISTFNFDGSDSRQLVPIVEDSRYDSVYFETSQNWTAYEQSEEEQRSDILCPHCNQFPFATDEVQVHDVVRVVCFKDK